MTLIVDSPGARRLDYGELKSLETPTGTKTWKPIPHSLAVDYVSKAIEDAGFEIEKADFAVARGDDRFFGTFDLKSEVTEDTTLTVGVRNSIDKSLSFGMVCGERCVVCTNLCFGADNGIELFRKHSGNIENDLFDRIKLSIDSLDQYQIAARHRIRHMKSKRLDYNSSSTIILDAFRKRVIGTTLLKQLVKEWDRPSYPEFTPRTAWSLNNALTHVIKSRQQRYPIRAARETLQFQALCV
ncbi:MAG: DUF932 domain-containing protein [Planctomycetota bacterium]